MGEIIMDGDFNDVMLNQDRVSKITNSKPQRNVHVLMLEQLMVERDLMSGDRKIITLNNLRGKE